METTWRHSTCYTDILQQTNDNQQIKRLDCPAHCSGTSFPTTDFYLPLMHSNKPNFSVPGLNQYLQRWQYTHWYYEGVEDNTEIGEA